VTDTGNPASSDVRHYTYRVTWSTEDGEYLATCLEFPSLSWLAGSRTEAMDGLEHLITEVVEDMDSNDEKAPVPLAERRFSGTFNVRIGEHLHRNLAMHAAEERMSLNQYVVKKLASA
jgi:predicted HicB family RNase H-like nuclease